MIASTSRESAAAPSIVASGKTPRKHARAATTGSVQSARCSARPQRRQKRTEADGFPSNIATINNIRPDPRDVRVARLHVMSATIRREK